MSYGTVEVPSRVFLPTDANTPKQHSAVKMIFSSSPWMSASFPNGTKNTTEASKNEVAIQLNVMASADSSFPMEGSAMFIEEPVKGTRKEASTATVMIEILLDTDPPG